jgi:hypothetical protein
MSFEIKPAPNVVDTSAEVIALIEDNIPAATPTIRGAVFGSTTEANTSLGDRSLRDNTTGEINTAIGNFSLSSNTTGRFNVAVGVNALVFSTTSSDNTALGYSSIRDNTTGYNNVAAGSESLYSNTTGFQNTAVGYKAGFSIITGSNNTLIGNSAEASSSSVSNEVTIGNSSVNRFRIPGLGIDWTSSNLPGRSKSYSLISTTSLSGSSQVTVSGLASFSSIFVGVADASMQSASNLRFYATPSATTIWSRTAFVNSATWSYQNIGGGLSAPGNNNDISIGQTATSGGSISASLMIDGVSSNGGKYFSWQSGGAIYNDQSVDAGASFSNGQGLYLQTQPITAITVASNSQFDGGTMYVYGSLS